MYSIYIYGWGLVHARTCECVSFRYGSLLGDMNWVLRCRNHGTTKVSMHSRQWINCFDSMTARHAVETGKRWLYDDAVCSPCAGVRYSKGYRLVACSRRLLWRFSLASSDEENDFSNKLLFVWHRPGQSACESVRSHLNRKCVHEDIELYKLRLFRPGLQGVQPSLFILCPTTDHYMKSVLWFQQFSHFLSASLPAWNYYRFETVLKLPHEP